MVLFAGAAVAALVGKNEVAQATPPAPEQAIQGVKEDIATVKGDRHDDQTPQTPEQLEAEIALQREQLAETVDQLAHKLDVKSQAQQRVASLKDAATTDTGKPRTEVLAAAGSLVAMAVVLLLWRRRGDR